MSRRVLLTTLSTCLLLIVNCSGWSQDVPPAAPLYADHFDLLRIQDGRGGSRVATTPREWELRRQHIRAALELVMGPLPAAKSRVALDVQVLEETNLAGGLVRRKLSYQSDQTDRVAAFLFLPDAVKAMRLPAMLCLQQTTSAGKAEPSGLAGDASLHYALALAQRGYVTLAPDYPGFGDSTYDFAPRHGYVSGSMKAVWDNVRAVDLLEGLPEVDATRIGVLGHSLGGHNALFTAVFEPRLKVVVSSCGFTTFRRDDMPSWAGPRYMPRIAREFGNDAVRVPFDFTEIIAALAPRHVLACAAVGDDDFDVTGVREVMAAARPVYELHDAADHLTAYYPSGPHGFPPDAREFAYAWLDRVLK